MENNKSYRIRTNVGTDKVLNVKLDQNYDFLEVLSLKLNQTNSYKLHTSNYGVIVGRVLANGGFGIPNAKVSVFIQVSDEDLRNEIISALYSYNTTTSKNADNIRYNLLTDIKVNNCHQVIGTFPNKRYVLDNDDVLEVYDNYYKFTTTTNEAGDYMIFGVPTGNQTIHVDLDLSDIGVLSQRPRDFIYKGYNSTQFENPNQFKVDTNLDSLTQVYSQDSNVYVYPFWGDSEEGVIGISRNDIQIQFKFEPTCVFIGSAFTDKATNGITKKCVATTNAGAMDELSTGNGTIEMIRKKADGSVEEVQIQGTQLINGDGIWCYQIPMNLDYVTTDEYGNMVPTDDPDKGIPTRTCVRFRMSLTDNNGEGFNNVYRAKALVPHNPTKREEVDYEFGSNTAEHSFKNLLWNNVYTVKGYIPRIQKGNGQNNKRFVGLKHTNIYGDNNPIPYNTIRIRLPFMFVIICIIIKVIIFFIRIYNRILAAFPCRIIVRIWKKRKCGNIPDGMCEELEGWYFAPGCTQRSGCKQFDNLYNQLEADVNEFNESDTQSINYKNNGKDLEEGDSEPMCLTIKTDFLIQCVEIQLAQEYKVIQFDFTNDWLNGSLYLPQFIRNIRKKRSYLFGLIKIKPKVQACVVGMYNSGSRRLTQQCALQYTADADDNYTKISTPLGCKNGKERCHKSQGRRSVSIFRDGESGLIYGFTNNQGQTIYYYKPADWSNGIKKFLFATDIVLLGSLNDCDLYGTPQFFKYLSSTTYQMPTNLALTNMAEEGYMYSVSGEKGTRCRNKRNVDLETMPQSKDSYYSHEKGLPLIEEDDLYNGSETVDEDATLITEMSGIDWGYTGPDQEVGGIGLGNLFYPGGHFLGISCTNSQTNIKSCVNLSRACEFGVWLSQRQENIKGYDHATGAFENSIIIPSGLISKDELIDSDARSMFSTLNYNRLKVVNSENGLYRYDFNYLYNNNFNGNLEGKGAISNKNDGPYYNLNDKINRQKQETSDKEYYRFRFGIPGVNDSNNKVNANFGGGNSQTKYFPIYENSYYFYFGLKEGKSAIDEFNKQYFSVCANESLDTYSIFVKTNEIPICGDSDEPSAIIELKSIDLPCTWSLYKGNDTANDLSEGTDEGYYRVSRNTNDILSLTKVPSLNNRNVIAIFFNDKEIGDTFTLTAEESSMLIGKYAEYFNEQNINNLCLQVFNGVPYKCNILGFLDEPGSIDSTDNKWFLNTINLYNLEEGEYTIYVWDVNGNFNTNTFSINKESLNINVGKENYIKEYTSTTPINIYNECKNNFEKYKGYITIDDVDNNTIIISSLNDGVVNYISNSTKSVNSYLAIIYGSNSGYTYTKVYNDTDIINDGKISVWGANTYRITLIKECSNGKWGYTDTYITISPFYELDMIVNGVSLKKLNTNNFTIDSDGKFGNGWTNFDDSALYKMDSVKMSYNMKRAFWCNTDDGYTVLVKGQYGTPPYSIYMALQSEIEVENEDAEDNEVVLGDKFVTSNNSTNDYIPTLYNYTNPPKDGKMAFYVALQDTGGKKMLDNSTINYGSLDIDDMAEIKEEVYTWFGFHILNKPFYSKGYFFMPDKEIVRYDGKDSFGGKCNLIIHNGISENGSGNTMGNLTINNESVLTIDNSIIVENETIGGEDHEFGTKRCVINSSDIAESDKYIISLTEYSPYGEGETITESALLPDSLIIQMNASPYKANYFEGNGKTTGLIVTKKINGFIKRTQRVNFKYNIPDENTDYFLLLKNGEWGFPFINGSGSKLLEKFTNISTSLIKEGIANGNIIGTYLSPENNDVLLIDYNDDDPEKFAGIKEGFYILGIQNNNNNDTSTNSTSMNDIKRISIYNLMIPSSVDSEADVKFNITQNPPIVSVNDRTDINWVLHSEEYKLVEITLYYGEGHNTILTLTNNDGWENVNDTYTITNLTDNEFTNLSTAISGEYIVNLKFLYRGKTVEKIGK